MLKLTDKIQLILVSALIGILVSAPVFADDTEIYSTASTLTQKTQPNVLFVLDTSGSMNDPTQSRPVYKPSTDYSGGSGCYDKNKVYAIIPPYSLVSSNNAQILCTFSSQGFDYYVTQVNRSAVKCKAADTLDATGSYLGTLSQYRKNAWVNDFTNQPATKDLTAYVECQADSGIDGQYAGSAKKWASSTNGPWSSSPSDSINWGQTGTSTTLYSGNYLNYIINVPSTYGKSKIQVMQKVISNLVNSTTGINIGLMRFDSFGNGGMVVTPMGGIKTNRSSFIKALNTMTAGGVTPLAKTLYESAMYYEGKAVDYGLASHPVKSIAASRIGGTLSSKTYKSPITNSCQKNFTILLTDGFANNDILYSSRLKKLQLTSCQGDCLDEIAGSIGTNDQSPLKGNQVISTYTIGFMVNNPLLKDTASASFKATGAGKYLLANNASTLTKAFSDILVDINAVDTSFSSPAVSVNAFNRTTHLNDLYFTLFKPGKGAHWDGNFKKYKLAFFVDKNDVNKNGNTTERLPYIADANGSTYPLNNAVDPATGFFAKGSKSYWTQGLADGPTVAAGGAASLLTNTRKVYTYTSTYTNDNGVFRPTAAAAVLTASADAVKKTNTAITAALLNITGLPDKIAGTPRIKTLLDWAAGIDVLDQYGTPGTTTDARTIMGDPLHSEPALVQYGGTATKPDLVAYVATNDGYLHAFNVTDGSEIFSFIPKELLPNLNTLMDDPSGKKTYGLDGNVVAWVDDKNGDGIINGSDHVYLYIGMRRGGRDIYALDVTDRNNPKLLWVIKGGSGAYAELGQTWSSINVEKVKAGGTVKTVLIFGGGYDTNQDSVGVRTKDSMGRAVYIADATTGKRLWMAGPGGDISPADMQYSIPARVKPLDLSGDGLIDRLYVADMGGQIFRFDINNDNNASLASSITGGRIANLAGSNKTDARRFYYPPDVALIAEKGKSPYLALAIASGYRAHPLNTTIHDRIYLLKDKDIYTTPASYTTLTEADLYDATLNLVAGNGTSAQNTAAVKALGTSSGWYIKLDDGTNSNTYIGEKGLSEALIINGTAVITTFTPTPAGGSKSCIPPIGSGKVYFLDVLDGSAAYPGSLDDRVDRTQKLIHSGIPPSPTVLIPKNGEPTLCIGSECQSAKFGLGVRKTFWYEEEK